VARGMAKDPDDRYPSVARLAAAAREAVATGAPNDRIPAPPTTLHGVPPPATPHPSEVGPASSGPVRLLSTGPPPARSGTPLTDSRRFSRIASAASMVIGPVLTMVGALLLIAFPDPDDDRSVFLDAVAADRTMFLTSSVLSLLGLLFLVHGLTGVAHMLRGRYVGVGQLGIGLLIASAILGKTYTFDVVVAVAAGDQFDRTQVLTVIDAAATSPWLEPVRLAALGGVLGLVLVAVDLVLRRATAMWIPVLLGIAAAVRGVLAESGIDLSQRVLTLVDTALFAIPAIGLAIRILRFSDEEWSWWAPLGDVPEEPSPVSWTGEQTPTGVTPTPADEQGERGPSHAPS
jgi:hypothetical protein